MATYESRRYNTPVTDVTKIADGSVNNTEFEHLDGVTSDIQTQLTSKLPLAGGTLSGNLDLNDNVRLRAGNSQDFEFFHDSSNSYIKNGTGAIVIQGDNVQFKNAANNATLATFTQGGNNNLRFNGSTKLETTNTGVAVTGAMAATTLTGNGSGLTNLNGSNIASGTVPDARLPASALSAGLNGGEFFTANGSWTCPTGITKIIAVITAGGGGGGGQGVSSFEDDTRSGAGGSGGNFEGMITVSPGTTYNIVIGAGGACGNNTNNKSLNPGSAGGNTTAFGITATAGGGGSGSYTGQNGQNPNDRGVRGTDGSASGTSVVAFRTSNRNNGALVMQGSAQPTSGLQSFSVAGAAAHTITGSGDPFAFGVGGSEGNNVGQSGNYPNMFSGTGGNAGGVQIFF